MWIAPPQPCVASQRSALASTRFSIAWDVEASTPSGRASTKNPMPNLRIKATPRVQKLPFRTIQSAGACRPSKMLRTVAEHLIIKQQDHYIRRKMRFTRHSKPKPSLNFLHQLRQGVRGRIPALPPRCQSIEARIPSGSGIQIRQELSTPIGFVTGPPSALEAAAQRVGKKPRLIRPSPEQQPDGSHDLVAGQALHPKMESGRSWKPDSASSCDVIRPAQYHSSMRNLVSQHIGASFHRLVQHV
ncbi:hypothetical protein B0T25DRAFT_80604 [Lasiosphaeria hispida]|uniref:Uncharacterized protein n=1 Tax=Lasiosphaeria hispida TaxID=260671 RepID=A0AAJ0MH62_9PEZI|nr:hypothetical protein B0T25DRAFT_80604 [Lasiosphaeria hispida]